jgi:NhaA family Na+:H+ antiporter
MDTAAAGGVVLLAAAIIALIWANSPWGGSYTDVFDTPVSLQFGSLHIEETIKGLINDGLMAIFFFVVGLEIKRELVVGELNEVRKAALPVMAAFGGMVVPALIYVAIVVGSGSEGGHGWGIPMATDIAFSIGVVALLGSRIPSGAKLFLLALAIVDDIGAIAVIAVFYTVDLHFGWLILGVAGLVMIRLAAIAGVRSMVPYVAIALVVWLAFLESGVHATIAGVVLGLMTPVRPHYTDNEFRRRATWILERWDMNRRSPEAGERLDHDALELSAVAQESVSPLNRMEHQLHLWSSFVIVPLFGLANAGVRFVDLDVIGAVLSPVALGVALGLAIGKPIGITFATWLALRLDLGRLPARTSFNHIVGLGMLAGIGFTVSLFIAELAFTEEILRDEAKIGIFAGSAIAGVVAVFVLRSTKSVEERYRRTRETSAAGTGE